MNNIKSTGTNVYISPNVEIKRPQLVEIGSNCAIDSGFYCTTTLVVGDYVHIGPYVTVIGGPKTSLTVGHFSGIAAGCRIICASEKHMGEGLANPMVPDEYRDEVIMEPIVIEEFVTVGTNVVISPGVTIGQGAVIGANSFVNKNIEPWTVYIGSPAKPLKSRRKDKIAEYAKALGYNIEIK
jgi:acetyltransferase-like isoleucine patch superfamily enzyme